MRTNRRQRHHLGRWKTYRPASSQRISSRARWRTENQTVAAIARQRFAVHTDIQFDQTRSDPAADNNVVQGAVFGMFSIERSACLNQRAGLEFKLSVPHLIQGLPQFSRRDSREKSQSANVDAEHRGSRSGNRARDAEHRSIAAKNHHQIHAPRQRSRVRRYDRLQICQLGGRGFGVKLTSRIPN